MANSYLYIITHVYLQTHIYYVPTTYLLYICYIKLHSFHLCSFCCFSEMLFVFKILTIDMLGIYHGYSDMACWMSFIPLWWGILFMWSKYHFVQYIYFCIPKNIFSTSFILWAWLIISHVPFLLNSLLIFIYRCLWSLPTRLLNSWRICKQICWFFHA